MTLDSVKSDNDLGIRGRLLALTLGVAVPLALAGIVALWGLWTASRRQLDDSVRQRAEVAAVSLERWIDSQQKQLTTIARYAMARRASAPVSETLRVTATSLTWVDVRVVNPDGGTELSEPDNAEPLPTEMIVEVFDDVRRRRRWTVATDARTIDTTQPMLTLGAPVDFDRVAIARVNGAAVRDFFNKLEPSNGEVFVVFDRRGRIVYRSQTAAGRAEIAAASGALFVAALAERPAAVIEVVSPFDGVPRIYGMAHAGATDFVVAVGEPSAIVYAPARRQFTGYAVFSFAALLCAVFAALVISGGIARPLRRLKFAVQRFGEGDTASRAPVAGTNEIAEVGAAFNLMAAQTQERERRLTELDRLKSEFVGSVSHELRTPLTTIKTLTRVMLREEMSEAERREYLETIAAACDREISLVVNLLDLSKLEAGTFNVSLERVDAAEVAHACIMSNRAAAAARKQELRLEMPDGLPPLRADYASLRRVLCELVESAIKYTPEGGRITLSAQTEGAGVAISVSDTGRGIHSDDVPHVFDKFYRGRAAAEPAETSVAGESVNPPEPAEVPGVGVGLYVARRLVELMNGSIEVESASNRGARFTVRLPAWSDEDGEAD